MKPLELLLQILDLLLHGYYPGLCAVLPVYHLFEILEELVPLLVYYAFDYFLDFCLVGVPDLLLAHFLRGVIGRTAAVYWHSHPHLPLAQCVEYLAGREAVPLEAGDYLAVGVSL